MAGLVYALSDARVMNVWEKKLDREVRARDPLLDPEFGLAGTGPDSLVIQKDSLSNGPGAFIRIGMKYQLDSRGRAGDEVLKGFEDSYKTANHDVYVNVVRNAVGVSTPMAQQYVSEDTIEESTDSMADWMANRFSFVHHAHAAGISLITDEPYRFHNTINAIASDYIIRPNGKTAGNLTSGDGFDIDIINDAIRKVKLLRPKIRPAQTKWGPRYCCFLAPEQVWQLRKSDSLWYAKMTSALQGGRVDDNPLFTTALGEDNGVLFFESDFVPPGLNSGATKLKASTRRAWIGGAGALALAFGRGYEVAPGFALNRFQWNRETEDYGHQKQIAATTIVGCSRPRFTNPKTATAHEAAVLVIETYADAGGLSSSTNYDPWVQAGCTIEA